MKADPTARLGAALAGASGLLLFISLFLNWYTVPGSGLTDGSFGDVIQDIGGTVGFDVRDAVKLTGWEAFEITDVVCVAAAAVAAVRGLVAVLGESDNPPVPGNMLTAILGAAALALVLYRTVNPPYIGLDPQIGLWIGVLAAACIVYGSYLAIKADRADREQR